MRLDSYLVEIGNLTSRGRAKRAILEGYVKVNDTLVTKPSFDVAYSDKVEVEDGLDKPAGYWKLKDIQDKTGILRDGDRVLDIGSSAGGFLMFASGIASSVHGIEFSREFHTQLTKLAHEIPNITVEFADVFTIPMESPGQFDVMMMDITANPLSSIKALEHMLPALKSGGMLLIVLKLPKDRGRELHLSELSSLGIKVTDIIEPDKQEAYVIARKL
ncbi:MAG: S4 domain-containing protein [Candidatus Methanoperedens sp.]|jgi:23S rRNA (cytidine1920-2'-O)/16S rRNA (cytidine1409-2'-O)-methyltransferase|nr:S4 domain-containing protein [Candidatus Methanoperedens sp.]PKL52764.1 MAG: cell division protein FtsJ [Candidatus Methanoperedenaceae archaeon HGW-Methanoperedenaceae-1]